MGGDEEDDAGIDKYSKYTDAKDSRLFHAGTASGSYVDNRNASLARTIIVTDATGLKDIKDAEDLNTPDYKHGATTVNLSGQHVSPKEKGIIIKNGKKILKR